MKTRFDLDKITVASPCNARWDDMTGNERARFCGSCRKNVYNLSTMTRAEIVTLIREKEGNFCGRFYQRVDGRLLTADCPTGWRRRRERLARWCGSVFASLLMFLGVRAVSQAKDTTEMRVLMGEMPARMGDIAVPTTGMVALPLPTNSAPTHTNQPTIKTNAPQINPLVMGKICLPPQTNPPARIEPKPRP